jgi:RNA polymerase sigma-70 factor (ECF subfamily)
MDHESDERLMQQVGLDMRQPLSVLLRRYASPLATFLRRMCGDHHLAEELFQETFLAVWTSRKKYQHPRPFRSWLFGIATNKCRLEQRRVAVPLAPLNDGGAAAPVAGGPSPVEAAIAAETAALVDRVILRLPAQQRSVMVLRVWNGLSYAEIAETLQLTEATVRSHMFHALERLRQYLEPRMADLPGSCQHGTCK